MGPPNKPTESLIRPVMPELDSLRGAAVLLVVIFHGFAFPATVSKFHGIAHAFVAVTAGGWTGVNLFFVLSGFLITGILFDSKARPDYYSRFYVRRALRILPAFYLLLLLLMVLPRTGLFEQRHVGWPFVLLSFLYLANMTGFFGVPGQYGALWSLAVEEHFYLLWPWIIRKLTLQRAIWCAAAIVVACPCLRACAYFLGYHFSAGYTWLVADGLALGSLFALLVREWSDKRAGARWFAGGCASVAMLLFVIGTPLGIWKPGSTFFGGVFWTTAVNLVYATILGCALLIGTSKFKWVVNRPLLQWFGYISYGLYLIQMLAFDFVDHWILKFSPSSYARMSGDLEVLTVRFLASLAVATTAAFLSRRYFEEPFLRLKDRLLVRPATKATELSPTKAVQQQAAEESA